MSVIADFANRSASSLLYNPVRLKFARFEMHFPDPHHGGFGLSESLMVLPKIPDLSR